MEWVGPELIPARGSRNAQGPNENENENGNARRQGFDGLTLKAQAPPASA